MATQWAAIWNNPDIVYGKGGSILFKNVANVPSDIDSPIKGTTATTRSPSACTNMPEKTVKLSINSLNSVSASTRI